MANNLTDITTRQISDMRWDAVSIFKAGFTAVDPAVEVKKHCRREKGCLNIGDHRYGLSQIRNIYVVGDGKAFAPMAAAMEDMLCNLTTDGSVTVKYGHVTDHLTVSRARRMEMAPGRYLNDNDSYHFFQRLYDLVITGPTNTNVMDLRMILVR